MKKFFLLVFLFFPLSLFADNQFSDLDTACYNSMNGSTSREKLILKHINGRITKSEGYVKHDDSLYIVANTFTDSYRFLGSYLLSYDCKSKRTARLSRLLKKNISGELGFIRLSEYANAIMVFNAGTTTTAVWIYDLETKKLKTINNRLIKAPKGYKISWTVDLDTYNGESVVIEALYYTGNYNYKDYNNPDRLVYKF